MMPRKLDNASRGAATSRTGLGYVQANPSTGSQVARHDVILGTSTPVGMVDSILGGTGRSTKAPSNDTRDVSSVGVGPTVVASPLGNSPKDDLASARSQDTAGKSAPQPNRSYAAGLLGRGL